MAAGRVRGQARLVTSGPCRSSSARRSAASPFIPPPTATPRRARWRSLPPTRAPIRRSRRSSRRSPTSSAASTATRTRRTPRCGRGCRIATACPPTGSRSATAPATSCSPPATRCSSPEPRWSTRGRAFSVYPHLAAASGARALEVSVDAEHKHDLAKMREEITVATRLVVVCNPNNPTSTALPLEEIAAFVADHPSARRGDPRRGLLRVQHPSGPRRVDPAAQAAPEPRPAPHLSKVCGLCRLRVGFALCGSEDFRTAVDQVRQPFFCNAAAQAAAVEALNHQDEVARRVERNLAERIGLEEGLRQARHRGRRVAGQLRLVRPPRLAMTTTPPRSSARSSRGSPSAASSSAPAARWGRARRAARDGRDRGGERALPGRARRAPLSSAIPRHAHQHRTARQLQLRRVFLRRRREPFRLGDFSRHSVVNEPVSDRSTECPSSVECPQA